MIPVLLQALCTWTDLDRQTCLIWWSALGRATWSRPVELRHLLALGEAQFPTLQGLRRPDVGVLDADEVKQEIDKEVEPY